VLVDMEDTENVWYFKELHELAVMERKIPPGLPHQWPSSKGAHCHFWLFCICFTRSSCNRSARPQYKFTIDHPVSVDYL